ncbi:hypothetical protein P168DRAFT_281501 [Aspergillus campestris IBT 28561]|uniref:Uncharacterized protein n=1 Tax=Aspergillus campestris (strain IBT 28561) TaxID=1392248 RepID=A0A2I1D5L3_ASPC2|nr:uncharacterized protein P168DRAFT_281501 [Aspergillus campestris IBT 28561]PKY05167.1 hypothetical protein P168DRAFT_281501 [Aspergillus campestris IBT 28561]
MSIPSNSTGPSSQGDLKHSLEALAKFNTTSAHEDINTAIEHAKASVEDPSRQGGDKAGALCVLASCYQQRYQASNGGFNDLDEAVNAIKAAVNITIRQPHVAGAQVYFINLERILCFRYRERKGKMPIEDSIEIVAPMLDLIQTGSPGHAFLLKILSALHSAGYEHTKDSKYLDEAIGVAQRAVSDAPVEHPLGRALRTELAQSLDKRFEKTQLISDLDSFIGIFESLLAVSDSDGEKFEPAHELAAAFERRYKLTSSPEDIAKAVEYGTSAVEFAPTTPLKGHPISARDIAYHNLRIHAKAYFSKTGNVPQPKNGVLERGHIVQMLVKKNAKDKAQQLLGVARAFQRLYETTNAIPDIEEALRLTMAAMQETDDSHAEWEAMQDSFRVQFRLWSEHTGKMSDFDTVVMAFERNGGTYIPPGLVGDLELKVPYMIYGGELPVE